MLAIRLTNDPFYWWLAALFLYSELVIVVVLITIAITERLATTFKLW